MSSSNTAELNPTSPLSFMQKLSPAVFIYHPSNESTVSATSTSASSKHNDNDPQLMLLLGWMDARDAHLARYIKEYRVLYPSTVILLVKARLAGLAWSSIGSQDTAPAVAAMQVILRNGLSQDSTRPRLLIHALSGGGSCSLYHLYNHFSHSNQDEGSGSSDADRRRLYIPMHVTIFDSAPGVWSYQFNVGVLTAPIKPGWRRLLALPVAHLVAATCWLLIHVMGVPDPQRTWSTAHNDKRINHEIHRVYIYSEADQLCPSSAVEAHAANAKTQGFDIQLERFEGSGHVAHMRIDADRYWRIVQETWNSVSRSEVF